MTRLIPRCSRAAWLAAAAIVANRISRRRAQAPAPDALRAKVRVVHVGRMTPRLSRELSNFLAIPNLASDTREHPPKRRAADPDDGARAASPARTLESPSGGPPAVYGELATPGAPRRSCSTRTTTANPSTRPAGRRRRGSRCCATTRSRRADASSRSRRRRERSRASGGCTAGRRATTRRRSSRCSPRSMRCAPPGVDTVGEPQVLLRGRGGSRLRTSA